MKSQEKTNRPKAELHAQILRSAVASFKIEGITISPDAANAVLKKVEATLEKQKR